ncbi:hypothetical protein HDU97_008935 [Phlyctochytrium planicorne]|nr:hypothetical protein HDU97_008935 [Phlyctochytrium planicorne]
MKIANPVLKRQDLDRALSVHLPPPPAQPQCLISPPIDLQAQLSQRRLDFSNLDVLMQPLDSFGIPGVHHHSLLPSTNPMGIPQKDFDDILAFLGECDPAHPIHTIGNDSDKESSPSASTSGSKQTSSSNGSRKRKESNGETETGSGSKRKAVKVSEVMDLVMKVEADDPMPSAPVRIDNRQLTPVSLAQIPPSPASATPTPTRSTPATASASFTSPSASPPLSIRVDPVVKVHARRRRDGPKSAKPTKATDHDAFQPLPERSKYLEVTCCCRTCSKYIATMYIFADTSKALEAPYVLDVTCVRCRKLSRGESIETDNVELTMERARIEDEEDQDDSVFKTRRRRKPRKDLGKDHPVFCQICMADVGYGGPRVPTQSAKLVEVEEMDLLRGGRALPEEDGVWVRPDFSMETICSRCFARHQFCTSCSGGGFWRSGKWRLKSLFEEGRKTCVLDHNRGLPASQARFIVFRVPYIATKRSTTFKDLDPMFYGQTLDYMPFVPGENATGQPREFVNLRDEMGELLGDDEEEENTRGGKRKPEKINVEELIVQPEDNIAEVPARPFVPGLLSFVREVSDFVACDALGWYSTSNFVEQWRPRIPYVLDIFKSIEFNRRAFRKFVTGEFIEGYGYDDHEEKEFRRFVVLAVVPEKKHCSQVRTFESIVSELPDAAKSFGSFPELGRDRGWMEGMEEALQSSSAVEEMHDVLGLRTKGFKIAAMATAEWNVTDRHLSFPDTVCGYDPKIAPGSYLGGCVAAVGLRVLSDVKKGGVVPPVFVWESVVVSIQTPYLKNASRIQENGFLGLEEFCARHGVDVEVMRRVLVGFRHRRVMRADKFSQRFVALAKEYRKMFGMLVKAEKK